MNMSRVLAADIGGSHISTSAVDLATGNLVPETRAELPINSKDERDTILDAWASCLNNSIALADADTLVGLAFAMPGPFNYRNGTAHFGVSDKYESLCDISVTEYLSPRLVKPLNMRFVNDATAFGIAEARKLADQNANARRVLAVTLGTGFGSAFLEHGVPVTSGDRVPSHGSLWHLPYREKLFDDFVSVRWIRSQFARIRNDEVSGVREIAKLARVDTRCAGIFQEYGENLAAAVTEWIARFNAQSLVIGGNIAGAYDLFSEPLEAALAGRNVEIVIVSKTDDSAIMGAARLFEDAFWDRIKNELPTQ